MGSRFATSLAVLLLAGFLTVACFAFAPPVLAWLAFGVACAATLIALIGFALPGRGATQRTADACIAIVAGWTIVASRCFTGGALKWIAFGDAALLIGLAVLALIAHEAQLLADLRPVHARNGDSRYAADFQPRAGARSGNGG